MNENSLADLERIVDSLRSKNALCSHRDKDGKFLIEFLGKGGYRCTSCNEMHDKVADFFINGNILY
jgi:hypothetical protein